MRSHAPVSVVIPAHNEESVLPNTLDSLLVQSRPPKEIIVVNNASTDQTGIVANRYKEKFTAQKSLFVVLTEPRLGIAYARNAGFRKATQPIIASTDSDTIVAPDWIARIVRHFKNHASVAVVGRIVMSDAPPFIRRLTQLGYIGGYFKLGRLLLGFHPLSTANCGVRKDAFDQTNGFDPRIKDPDGLDDVYLAGQLSLLGTITYDHTIIVGSSFRRYQSFSRFFHSTIRRYRAAWHIRKNHRKQRKTH